MERQKSIAHHFVSFKRRVLYENKFYSANSRASDAKSCDIRCFLERNQNDSFFYVREIVGKVGD